MQTLPMAVGGEYPPRPWLPKSSLRRWTKPRLHCRDHRVDTVEPQESIGEFFHPQKQLLQTFHQFNFYRFTWQETEASADTAAVDPTAEAPVPEKSYPDMCVALLGGTQRTHAWSASWANSWNHRRGMSIISFPKKSLVLQGRQRYSRCSCGKSGIRVGEGSTWFFLKIKPKSIR